MSEVHVGDARDIAALGLGKFRTILVDPPWFYNDQRKVRKDGKTPTKGIGACHHFDQLKTPDICALEIAPLAADRCHLFLWATFPLLPDALRVMRAWKFKFSTGAFAWIKINPGLWRTMRGHLARMLIGAGLSSFLAKLAFFGPGFFTGSNVEFVLLGWKGKPFAHEPGSKASQIVFAPRGKRHSAKPEEVQDRIESTWPDAMPRLELFARRPRAGWTVHGFEADGRGREEEPWTLGF